VIGIGGDGSMAILRSLAQQGNFNGGDSKTIDTTSASPSIPSVLTAVNIATEALDRLHFAASHSRVIILEVMGRDAGHIAISAGIAGGADVILIPEIPYTMTLSAAKSKNARSRQSYSLVIASEAVRTETGRLRIPID